MRWKTSLAVVATGLVLAGTAAAQTPAPGQGGSGSTSPGTTPGMPGSTTPGTPGTTTPSMPGATTPRMPGATPGLPGSSTPGLSDPTPGVQCPPGQARRSGSSICMPATPGAPVSPPTR